MDETLHPRDETPDVSHVKNPEVAHEQSDVNIGSILKFGVALCIVIAVILGLMEVLFTRFTTREIMSEPPPSPMADVVRDRLPPEPRLQGAPGHEIHPRQELRTMRAAEDSLLTTYGWVDQKTGIVRIPIAQAMRLVVERGLPVRAEGGEKTVSRKQKAESGKE